MSSRSEIEYRWRRTKARRRDGIDRNRSIRSPAAFGYCWRRIKDTLWRRVEKCLWSAFGWGPGGKTK